VNGYRVTAGNRLNVRARAVNAFTPYRQRPVFQTMGGQGGVTPAPEHIARESNVSQANGVLLTAEQVAKLLSVKRSWVYAQARSGRLPHVRVGRYPRFRRDALEAWIRDQERGPSVSPGRQPGGRTP
jgi:excisionase family DNA binding protein